MSDSNGWGSPSNSGWGGSGAGMSPDGGFAGGQNTGNWGSGNSGWSDAPVRQGGASASDVAIMQLILWLVGVVLAVVFVPVFIVGGLFYMLFRFGRFRISLISGVAAVTTALAALVLVETGGWADVASSFQSLDLTAADAKDQIAAVAKVFYGFMAKVGFVIGPWAGVMLASMQLKKMQQSPWLVVNEGLTPKWMYHFRFRMSPFESLKAKMEEKEIREDKLRPYGRRDLVPLGIEDEPLKEEEDPAKIKMKRVVCRAEDEVPKHTLVTGAAGSGKTVTLKSMMTRDIDDHKTIVVIDCKKDPEVAEFLSRRAHESGCQFYHFSADLPYRIQGNPEGPSSYDPLASGSVSKKVDMMLGTREWDTAAAVYRDQAQAYLSKVFATIEAARKYGVLDQVPQLDTSQGEMWTLTQMLDRNVFNAVIVALNKIPEAGYVRQQASELNAQLSPAAGRTPEGKATQHAQAEYLSKMSGLMVQNYGRWLKGGEGAGSGKIIDIAKLTSEPGNVILFSLDAAQQGDQGSLIGSMVCTDLANMTETRKNMGQDNPVAVYIDEFQSLPPDCVKSMLQKARSAGVGLTLAFQSLDQVSATTGNDLYVKSLLDTCSNFIFHAGSNTDTGELAAKIIGTYWRTRYMISRRNETKLGAFNWTNNRDLQVGTQQTQEWMLDPSSLQQLAMPNKQNHYTSEAIIIKKASSDPIDKGVVGAVSHKVRMVPPDCVLTEYFDPKSPAIDIEAPLEVRVSKGMAASAKLASEAEARGVTVNELTGADAGSPVAQPAVGSLQAPSDGMPGPFDSMPEPASPQPKHESPRDAPIVSAADVEAYKRQQTDSWAEYRRFKAQTQANAGSRSQSDHRRPAPRRPQQTQAPMPMPDFEETSAEDFLSATAPDPAPAVRPQRSQAPASPTQADSLRAPANRQTRASRQQGPSAPQPAARRLNGPQRRPTQAQYDAQGQRPLPEFNYGLAGGQPQAPTGQQTQAAAPAQSHRPANSHRRRKEGGIQLDDV